jgi:hypothetical protein
MDVINNYENAQKYIPEDIPINLHTARHINEIDTSLMNKEILNVAVKYEILKKVTKITGCTYIYYYDDIDKIIIWSHKNTQKNSEFAKYLISDGLSVLIDAIDQPEISTYCGLPFNNYNVPYKEFNILLNDNNYIFRSISYTQKNIIFQELKKLTGCFITYNNKNNKIIVWSNNKCDESCLFIANIIQNWFNVLLNSVLNNNDKNYLNKRVLTQRIY